MVFGARLLGVLGLLGLNCLGFRVFSGFELSGLLRSLELFGFGFLGFSVFKVVRVYVGTSGF